RVTR
ncbi:BCCT transporter family protein, partial [Vibrio parahaemolyticus IDH02640]